MVRLSSLVLCAAAVGASPAIAAPPAPTADWRLVVSDREQDVGRVLGFANVGTLRRTGKSVSFWLEYRLERPAEGADGYRGYVTADCATYAYSTVDLTSLAGDRIVQQGGEEKGLTASPGTSLRVAIDNVCTDRFQTGIVDPIAHARSSFGR